MDARARMEVRRKKILLNAEARMNKILGRPYEMKETSDELDASDAYNMMGNGFLNGAATSYEDTETFSTAYNTRLGLPVQGGTKLMENQSQVSRVIDFLFFICLGILARLSYLIGLSWMFNENLLYPFLIAGIPWAFLHARNNLQISGMIPSILLFTGVPEVTVLNICKMTAFFRSLTQFFSLYLFFFIVFHCIIESITNSSLEKP